MTQSRRDPPEPAIGAATPPAQDWLARGLALRASGAREQALECFTRALDARHDDVAALVGQGQLLFELARYEDAADSFELALAFAPDCVDALLGLARLARKSGQPAHALRHLLRAAPLAPRNADVQFELGLAHNRSGDTAAALSSYQRALELDSRHLAACVNLGLMHLTQLGDAPRAQELFEHAVALDPLSVAAQANLGLALQEQGRLDAALAHYARLIAAHPEVAEYRWNRGLALLGSGDFARGWEDYELRTARGERGGRRFPFAAWDGSAPSQRHLLIYGEQGLGDEIMFASCIPDVLHLARSTVIECDARLAKLFRRSFPQAQVHGGNRDGGRDWLREYPQIDTQIASGSLPRLLRRRWSDFPAHRGYLSADPQRVMHWQSRLAALGGGLKVGLAWRGGTPKTRRDLRSLAVEQCLPLTAGAGCRWVCLQYGDCGSEVEKLRQQGSELAWWPEVGRDVDELAALVSALDLVIAVPSSLIHLTGAVGTPVWIALSASPEWRYLWQGERMPWYPSAVLFRQSEAGRWDDVVSRLRQRLDAFGRGSGLT